MSKFKKRNYTDEEYGSIFLTISGVGFVGCILAFSLDGGWDSNKSPLVVFFSFSPLIMSLILGILYRKKWKINKKIETPLTDVQLMLFRVLLSAIGFILVLALIDYCLDGSLKYILSGITSAIFLLYNEKKNRDYKKTKDSNQ